MGTLANPQALPRTIPLESGVDRLPRLLATRPTDRWAALIAAPLVIGIVAGMALGSAPLMVISSIGAFVAAITVPYAGLAIVAFTAPLAQPSFVPAPGFESLLVGAILMGCIYQLPIDQPRLKVSPILVILLGFLLYAGVQQVPEMLTGYAGDEAHAVGFLFGQLVTWVALALVAGYLVRGRAPYLMLTMALAGAALTGVIAIANNDPAGVIWPLANLAAPTSDIGRATGPFSNPNYLGAYVSIMLVATLALLPQARSRKVWMGMLGLALLLAVALAMSLSRGALVAAIAGVTVVVVYRWRVVGFGLLVVGLIAAILIYPAFVQWRLESLTGAALPQAYLLMSESDDGRLVGILAAPLLFLTAPVFGIGFGHFVPMSVLVGGVSAPVNAHNWYLTVLAEQGVFGIVLWALLIASIVLVLRGRQQSAARTGFPVLITLGVAAFFLEPPTTFQLIAVPTIIIVAAMVSDWIRTDPMNGTLQVTGARPIAPARAN